MIGAEGGRRLIDYHHHNHLCTGLCCAISLVKWFSGVKMKKTDKHWHQPPPAVSPLSKRLLSKVIIHIPIVIVVTKIVC